MTQAMWYDSFTVTHGANIAESGCLKRRPSRSTCMIQSSLPRIHYDVLFFLSSGIFFRIEIQNTKDTAHCLAAMWYDSSTVTHGANIAESGRLKRCPKPKHL